MAFCVVYVENKLTKEVRRFASACDEIDDAVSQVCDCYFDETVWPSLVYDEDNGYYQNDKYGIDVYWEDEVTELK